MQFDNDIVLQQYEQGKNTGECAQNYANSAPQKKNEKNRKKCLTFLAMSGILTKLFDGDEVQKSGTKKFEKT